jgi:hypothetical protein
MKGFAFTWWRKAAFPALKKQNLEYLAYFFSGLRAK